MSNQSRSNRWIRAVATGFGVGYIPPAPGTCGALEGLALVWLVHQYVAPEHQLALIWLLVATLGVVAVLAAGHVARNDGDPDPQKVVIDEVVGQIACFVWVPVTPLSLLIGLLLFRLFDIAKPFPAGRAEHLPGGFGIIGDDLVAAVYAGVGTRLLLTVLQN